MPPSPVRKLHPGIPGRGLGQRRAGRRQQGHRHGVADAERLGIQGTSYGGYATVLLITQTDRFRPRSHRAGGLAVVLHPEPAAGRAATPTPRKRARTGWAARSGNIPSATSPTRPSSKPTGSRPRCRASPATRTPTSGRPVAGDLLYALRRLGKKAVWLRYHDGAHGGPNTNDERRDMYKRMLAWYDTYLKPAAAPHRNNPDGIFICGGYHDPIILQTTLETDELRPPRGGLHPRRPRPGGLRTADGGQGLRTAAAPPPEFESCTSVFAGRLATADGSTMTSHSCDSGTDRTWITIVPHAKHAAGSMEKVYFEPKRTKGPNDTDRIETGEIPYPAETSAFDERRLPDHERIPAGHRRDDDRRPVRAQDRQRHSSTPPSSTACSSNGPRPPGRLTKIADELTKAYGYNDYGESFTFADPRRSLTVRDLQPRASGRKGAVWAAQRIPTTRSASRPTPAASRKIDLKNKATFPGVGQLAHARNRDGLLEPGSRGGVRVLPRLRAQLADEPRLPPPRVARPEPARAVRSG